MATMTLGIDAPSIFAPRTPASAARAAAFLANDAAFGPRTNRGVDNPAGLIASESLRAELARLDAESRSMERADAVARTADGALAEISDLLSQAGADSVALANTAGLSPAERDARQLEIDSALQSVDRLARTTFNGQPLLDGRLTLNAAGASVQITSAATTDLGRVTISGADYRLSDVRSGGRLSSSGAFPAAAAQVIEAASAEIAALRGRIGAFQADQLAPQLRSAAIAAENIAAADAALRGTDYPAEIADLLRPRSQRLIPGH